MTDADGQVGAPSWTTVLRQLDPMIEPVRRRIESTVSLMMLGLELIHMASVRLQWKQSEKWWRCAHRSLSRRSASTIRGASTLGAE